MRKFFHALRLFLAACVVTACTPARTGVIGNTLTTNVRPVISITGNSPFSVRSHGRITADGGPTTTTGPAYVTFDYAFFTPDGATPGFAYAAIARIQNENGWAFQPPAPFTGAFSSSDTTLGGFAWSVQLLRVPSAGDWASGVWEDLGGGGTDAWLAKRWIAHLNGGTRAIMEYREPWPETIPALSTDVTLLASGAADAILRFNARADTVFSVAKKGGDFTGERPKPAPSSRIALNVPRLVGALITLDHN